MSTDSLPKKPKEKKSKHSLTSTVTGDTNPSSTSAISGSKRQNDSQEGSTKKNRQLTSSTSEGLSVPSSGHGDDVSDVSTNNQVIGQMLEQISELKSLLGAQNAEIALLKSEASKSKKRKGSASETAPILTMSTSDVCWLDTLNNSTIQKFALQFKPGFATSPCDLMTIAVKGTLSDKFASLTPPILDEVWQAYSPTDLLEKLVQFYPRDSSSSQASFETLSKKVVNSFKVSILNLQTTENSNTRLRELESHEVFAQQETALVTSLVKHLSKGDDVSKHLSENLGLHDKTKQPASAKSFRAAVIRETTVMRTAVQQVGCYATVMVNGVVAAAPLRAELPPAKLGKTGPSIKGNSASNSGVGAVSAGPERQVNCHACGHDGHLPSICPFLKNKHPNVNDNTKTPFADSAMGKRWLSEKKQTKIPLTGETLGEKWNLPSGFKRKSLEFTCLNSSFPYKTLQFSDTSELVPFSLFLPQSLSQSSAEVGSGFALLDSGALGPSANFLSKDLASRVFAAGGKATTVSCKLCTGVRTASCFNLSETVSVVLEFTPELTSVPVRLPITCVVLDSAFDLIIGKSFIKSQNLSQLFPSHFTASRSVEVTTGEQRLSDEMVSSSTTLPEAKAGNHVILTTLQLRNLTSDHDSSEWHAPAFEAFESVVDPPITQSDDPISLMTIEFDDELTEFAIKSLVQEFVEIFSETLPPEPAKLPPFNIEADLAKWQVPRNSGPPRPQTPANQLEIKRQLDLLQAQNIVRPSSAAFYSQVLLTEKPPKGSGKKRFCIDYVNLNNCCTSTAWPIPNIKQMLQRLGTKRAKYFAVLDLTSGYHQAPVSQASILLTAFICFCGVYEYLRVPFGPKGAPPYFQYTMSTVVLAGLIYIICEVYLDDIIIHGRTAVEFLDNLRAVFERIRKHNIKLHPRKVRIGLRSVEYTGHVIDSTGISFSRKKIDTVLDFAIPTTQKQLKQFLGIANYFRDHIEHLTEFVAPLQKYVLQYNKRKASTQSISLSPEDIESFNKVKSSIEACPKLFFLDEVSPIVLETDASKWGIGAFLYQIVDGVKRPIGFMSKSFTEPQTRWDPPQQEAYAIYMALSKFEYLLRDRKFTIRTDHKNFTYLSTSFSSMIRKWKIFISEFDFTVEHIDGIKNFVADAFSRLCVNVCLIVEINSILCVHFLSSDHHRLISKVHNGNAGHSGVERTFLKLVSYLNEHKIDHWDTMRADIRLFIRQCPCCQKMSVLKVPIRAHPFTVSSYSPMERLNIDFVGPFPDDGYLLVIIDCFSRWTELYCCVAATAMQAALALLDHVGRFGAPVQLLSDRGSHFVNETISEFLTLIGTEHCLTIAYSKEESALVERQNREVNRHLRALIFDRAVIDDYKLAVPLVRRLLNTHVNSRTGISAADLLFGQMINLDRGIFLPQSTLSSTDSQRPLSTHMTKLLSIQSRLLQIAQSNLEVADSDHIGSAPAERTEFPIGSYVLLDYPNGPPTRLHLLRRGPFKVLRFNRNDYVLFDLVTNKEMNPVNITRLRKFDYDPLVTDPRLVANKENRVFDVEKVLAHRGNTNRLSTLEFLVQWRDFPPEDNSWEPWKSLRTNFVLHDYFRSKGLDSLIPKQFRR